MMNSGREGDSPRRSVLLIEDNPAHARLMREMVLEAGAGAFELEHVARLSAGLERLAQGGVDVVLLDLSLPDATGFETFLKVRSQAPDVPVVVMSGLDDEDLAVKAVGEGAQDYLVKGQAGSALLVRSMRYAIERHRLLDELERAQQEELLMKDRFLSHVSHELRSPLTAIYQFVTIMLDGLAGDLSNEQREYLGITLRNITELRGLIEDLLQVTRAREGKMIVDPRGTFFPDLVAETLESLETIAESKNIVLSNEVSDDLPPVYVDARRAIEILVNLVDNGIKFTSEGGRITVRTEVSTEDPGFICVAVTDTGCGIGPEDRERVFEYMYQGEATCESGRKGLGLGLYICKELVSLHGGRIWVESEIGHGSTFFFTLPIYSLTAAISHIVNYGTLSGAALSLVTVQVFPVDKYVLTDSDEPAISKVWDVIGGNVVPGVHVLLPRMARKERAEFFFLATRAGHTGVEELVVRLREDLALCDDLQASGLGAAVSVASVSTPIMMAEQPLEEVVEAVASSIEAVIRDILLGKEESRDGRE